MTNRQNKIHRNPTTHSHPDVSHLISRENSYIPSQPAPAPVNLNLISREYTCIPSKSTPAQAGKPNKIHRKSKFSSNPDVFKLISRDYTYTPSQHTPAPVNLNLISREYTYISSQSIPAQAGKQTKTHRKPKFSSDLFVRSVPFCQ